MNILFCNPFHTGSHKAFAEGLQKHSQHNIQLLTLPGRHWKWRMHGAAVAFAEQVNASSKVPDLVLTTDMMDVATFAALTRKKLAGVPIVLWFHENQLTYPWSPTDADVALKRDNHYAFINLTSALAADAVWFNSKYHQTAFLEAVPGFLNAFPDQRLPNAHSAIAKKSTPVNLALDLARFDPYKQESGQNEVPLVLWNHRWEFDKNPETFFNALFQLSQEGVDFQLAVLGERYKKVPPVFEQAKELLQKHIVQFGYAQSFQQYAEWLWRADVLPVTSNQDFFGISAVEAMYCHCVPLLPNRLAFPQHLPKKLAAQHLYNTDQELLQKLRNFLKAPTPVQAAIPAAMRNYDWGLQGAEIDHLLQAAATKAH